ncbi:hypothetical protein [Paucibacter soli]|uniref:hypothetical protein n=1 Tax=Paucibacter soli TaxID=3133433 RepID=UPI003097A421
MSHSSMHHLRRLGLRRAMVALLLMAWAWGWAAPLIQPVGLQLVCGSAGMRMLEAQDDASGGAAAGLLQAHGASVCSQCCLPLDLPLDPPGLQAASHSWRPAAASRCPPSPITATQAASLPARGPPCFA